MTISQSLRRALLYCGKLCAAYIVLALFLAAPTLSYHWRNNSSGPVPALAAPAMLTPERQIGKPLAIFFVRQERQLPVSEGQYSEKMASWEVAEKEVQWIQTGTVLTEGKPSMHAIFYGHATEAVLGITRSLRIGDQLIITTETGTKLTYAYANDEIVLPSNVNILSEKNAQQLTLITCHGPNDMYRRLMKFHFIGAQAQ